MNFAEETFEVAVVQIGSKPGESAENVNRALSMVEETINEGRRLRLVCLPEAIDVGYDLDFIKRAELPTPPESLARMTEFAARHHLGVVFGSIERIAGKIFNVAFIVLPDGRISRYEKTHLFSSAPLVETAVFARGDGRRTVVPWNGIKIGVQICYDVRFPEMTRSLCIDGADVIGIPAAWPAVRRDAWRTLVVARAIENQVFVLAANQVPSGGEVVSAGTSLIVAPDGRVLAEATETDDQVLVATLDMPWQRKHREFLPLWADRRPELYRLF